MKVPKVGLLKAGDLVGMPIGLNVDRKRHVVVLLAVVVVPLLQLAQSLYALSRLPAFWRFYADPPYMYLFNSLSLGTGLTPQHVDHPGTSLQWLMAGIERATFALSGSQDSLPADIAWDPEKYLTMTGVVLSFLFAVSVAFFLGRIAQTAGAPAALVAGILILAASGLTVPWIVTATPEALVAVCVLLVLGILMPTLMDRSAQIDWRLLVIVGVLLAIGVTAKIIILPLLVVFIFVLRLRDLFILAGITAIAALLILIPVFELFTRMFGWFTNLARTSGRYGGESPSSVTSNLQAGLSTVTREFGLTWVVFALFLILFVVALRRPAAGIAWSMRLPAAGIALTIVASIAVSFKESTDRDFISLVGLVPTLAALMVVWLRRIEDSLSRPRATLLRRLCIAGVALIVSAAALANYRSFTEIDEIRERSDREVATMERASQGDGVTAHAFLAQNEYFALMLGSEWAYHPYSDEIIERFSDKLYFNAFLSTVFGTKLDGSIGYLECRDFVSLMDSGNLTFVLPGDFTLNGDRENTGEIMLADGSVLTFDPNEVELFAGPLSSVPIQGCRGPA